MFERLWQSVSWLLRLLPGGGRREARLVVGRGEGGVTKQGGAAAAAHTKISALKTGFALCRTRLQIQYFIFYTTV